MLLKVLLLENQFAENLILGFGFYERTKGYKNKIETKFVGSISDL